MNKKPVCVYVLHSDKKSKKKNTKFVWRVFLFFQYLVMPVNGEKETNYF